MLAYLGICLFMQLTDFSFWYVMLAWNILLANLPLFFINFSLLQVKNNKRVWAVVFGILWLIFFPNSVYMITDFIHISNDKIMWYEEGARYSINNGAMYSHNIMHWVELLIIGIGVIYGLLIGMESLYIFYYFLKRKFPKSISGLIIIGISLISGFAVYIGRFLRFNSWDLFMPHSLFGEVFTNVDAFTIEFMFVFAGFILILFLLYVLFYNNIEENLKQNGLNDER